jgi:hypothetical protein
MNRSTVLSVIMAFYDAVQTRPRHDTFIKSSFILIYCTYVDITVVQVSAR